MVDENQELDRNTGQQEGEESDTPPPFVSKRVVFAGALSAGSPAQLFVSLYLVVLAFFIVLTSIAKIQEQRFEEAIQSVKTTFQVKVKDKSENFIRIAQPIGSEMTFQSYLSKMRKFARDLMQITDTEFLQRGNQLEVVIDTSKLFMPSTTSLTEGAEQFLEKLADEMAELEAGQRVDTEFLFGLPSGEGYITAQTSLALARSGALALRMEAMGIPAETVFVGASRSLSDTDIRIRFYERVIDEEQVIPAGVGDASS